LSAGSKAAGEAEVAAAVGIGSVTAVWLVVHTVFTVRYARLYYLNGSSGIDFNQDDGQPTHGDFAYLAFIIGMPYQVSDTDLKTRTIRGHRVAPGPVVVRAGGGDPCDYDQPGRGAKQRQ
jgi:uncharacterized membrane protein